MLLDRGKNKQKAMVITALGLGVVLVILGIFLSRNTGEPPGTPGVQKESPADVTPKPGKAAKTEPGKVVTGKIIETKPIDYHKVKTGGEQKDLMDERKKALGIDKSLDMIVKSDESFIVGKSKVSMGKILEQAFARKGEVYQKDISDSGASGPRKIKEYGIYVVQPGDNIWNIHFGILKDYYRTRGISLADRADEPGSQGLSSGVGKILKFSETMVIIYNLVEKKIARDINLLTPLSKVVVYNMDAVFALLEEINFEDVNRIQFDGKNIWIPADKS